MPSAINKVVLIIGATSGIGEGLTRRIHAQGKKVIAAGRREDRLRLLAKELPGLCTVCLDISDIENLPTALSAILQDHTYLDTVIVSAGIQSYFSIKEGHSSSPSKIQSEFDINLTGPAVLSHLIIPHFLQREDNSNPSTICFIGSGLAFVPLPLMPIYCASKAGLHSLCVSLRAELDGTHVNIVEICPPYVETELDKSFRDEMIARLGGPEKAPKPMPVSEFLDHAMEGLLVGRSEIGTGFGQAAFDTWRKAFGPFLERFHING